MKQRLIIILFLICSIKGKILSQDISSHFHEFWCNNNKYYTTYPTIKWSHEFIKFEELRENSKKSFLFAPYEAEGTPISWFIKNDSLFYIGKFYRGAGFPTKYCYDSFNHLLKDFFRKNYCMWEKNIFANDPEMHIQYMPLGSWGAETILNWSHIINWYDYLIFKNQLYIYLSYDNKLVCRKNTKIDERKISDWQNIAQYNLPDTINEFHILADKQRVFFLNDKGEIYLLHENNNTDKSFKNEAGQISCINESIAEKVAYCKIEKPKKTFFIINLDSNEILFSCPIIKLNEKETINLKQMDKNTWQYEKCINIIKKYKKNRYNKLRKD